MKEDIRTKKIKFSLLITIVVLMTTTMYFLVGMFGITLLLAGILLELIVNPQD